MQVLCFLYLSLKCANSENSFIFKNGEERKNINTQVLHNLNETVHFRRYLDIPEVA